MMLKRLKYRHLISITINIGSNCGDKIMGNKILIGLTEIAGYYSNLKKGFDTIGEDCTFVNVSQHPFNYGGDDTNIKLINVLKWSYRQQLKHKSGFKKVLFFLFNQFIKLQVFIWATLKFDIFIFAFGQSFFNSFDLIILKLLNKKIILSYMGSDSRPPYINGSRYNNNTPIYYYEATKTMKRRVASLEKYSDHVIDATTCGHFHKKK